MTRIAIFAYASLVSRTSASLTLGRPVESVTLARLEGWSRRWSLARDNLASEKRFQRADGSLPHFCLGLNLEPDEGGAGPNGALLEVTEAELERLDLREIRYARTEVTAAVQTASGDPHGYDVVLAYRARPEHHRPEPPEDAIVIAAYPRTVEQAFARHGEPALAAYRTTTPPPPVEVIDAFLVEDRIPPGNPREW